jgi:hypothetical protein
VLGFCEYSNALSGSIKCGEFLGYLLVLEEGPCPVELGAHITVFSKCQQIVIQINIPLHTNKQITCVHMCMFFLKLLRTMPEKHKLNPHFKLFLS